MTPNDATELIKALTELGKPVVETACGLIDALLGEPFKVAGGMMGDQVYAWRWATECGLPTVRRR